MLKLVFLIYVSLNIEIVDFIIKNLFYLFYFIIEGKNIYIFRISFV